MAVLIFFAFVSGIVTILSPCILPVLPIVLSGSVGGGKGRPFGIVAAFAASFTLFTLSLSTLVHVLGIPPDALRLISVGLLVVFGFAMAVPALRNRFEIVASRLASRAGTRRTAVAARPASSGFLSGLPVGASLGLVWTPCVGPIMASVISLALTRRVNGGSVLITLAYSLGTALPMLAVMLGGRRLLGRVPSLSRNMAAIHRGFGVVMIVVGLAIAFGWDRQVQTALLRAFPSYGAGLTAVEQNGAVKRALDAQAGIVPVRGAPRVFAGAGGEAPSNGMLADYGMAPPLVAQGPWYNTAGIAGGASSAGRPSKAGDAPPLSMRELRGKVVLIDFWTYSCVNCVRTIPYLRAWYKAYKSQGLVIIGIHTPEFEFEKVPRNVQTAIKQLGVSWPVVQDNNYRQWNAYHNEYWPAEYFIGPDGHVRYLHFGEGDYSIDERVIQALLRERGASPSTVVSRPAPVNYARTPETYLGFARGRGLTSPAPPVPGEAIDYQAGAVNAVGQWNLSGRWTMTSWYVTPDSTGAALSLRFDAKNVYLVAQPESPGASIRVTVDGRAPRDTADVKGGLLRPRESRLYHIVDLRRPGEHLLRLRVSKGIRLYSFTFG